VRPAASPFGIRWTWLLLALVTGFYGVLLWAGAVRWIEGTLFQFLALTAAFKAFPPRSPVLLHPGGEPVPTARVTGKIPWVLAVLVLGLVLACRWAFHQNNHPVGLALLVSALLLAFAAVLGFRPPQGPDPAPDGKAFLLVLILAALLRFPFVGRDFTGLQIDEANHLLDGVKVLNGQLRSPFITGWWGNPSFVYYIYAAFFSVLGTSLVAGRIMAATLSLVALALFYRLARYHVSREAALLSTLLFSFAWFHLFYSLSPFTNIFTLLFEVCAFYHLERAMKEGRRADFAWTGLWAAAAVMSYISGRLVVGMLALSVAARFLASRREFLKAYGRHLLLALFAFLWLVGPFLVYSIRTPSEFVGRSKELSIFNEVKRTGDVLLPAKTFINTSTTFFRNIHPDPRFGVHKVPVVDGFTAALLVLGLAALLRRPRSGLTWIVLSGLLFGICANALAIQGKDPHPHYLNQQRLYLVLPFVFLAVAAGWDWLAGLLKGAGPAFRTVARWLLFGLVVLAGAANARIYYRVIPNHQPAWNAMGFNHLEIARLYRESAARYHLVAPWPLHSSVSVFMNLGRVSVLKLEKDVRWPLERRAERDVLILFVAWDQKDMQERVRAAYPGASWQDRTNRYGEPFLRMAVVTKDEWNSKAGSADAPELP